TKFDCWAQYTYIIDGDIMFHSVLYSARSEQTLRTSSVDNLGGKASHGCVRLAVDDAQWLFEHCAKGTIVIVE
ncbi:MAG: L,D-transpeptidase, partial [Clostridia bacterium]